MSTPKDNWTPLREQVRQAMKEKGLSGYRLAKICQDVTQPQISMYISGKRDLYGSTVDKIMSAIKNYSI